MIGLDLILRYESTIIDIPIYNFHWGLFSSRDSGHEIKQSLVSKTISMPKAQNHDNELAATFSSLTTRCKQKKESKKCNHVEKNKNLG